MKKRLLTGALLLCVLACALAVFYRPMSLAEAVLDEEGEVSILWVESAVAGEGLSARPEQRSSAYRFEAGSTEAEEVRNILRGYSCHRCLRTLFGDGTMEIEGGTGAVMHLTGRKSLSCSGSGEVLLEGSNYRMDYFGSRSSMALMEEMKLFLAGCTPES